ncbi:MAG: glycoside hydrolase family 9 protein [Bacteroidota bacterium]
MTQNFFLLLLLFLACKGVSQDIHIRVNLIGYEASHPKKALILSKMPINDAWFIFQENGKKVKEINPILLKKENWAPFNYYYEGNFTDIKTPGTYFLSNNTQTLRSEKFLIGNYPPIHESVVGFMQTQRCGFNPFTNEVCHPLDGKSFYGNRPDSSYVDATGGWHDAGDQLKYLITGSNATARMLMAYQWNPSVFEDKVNDLGLPQPNGIADVLDAATWGVDWIHTLHPSRAELIHQVADDRDHLGFKMPHEDAANYGWGKNKYRPVYFANGKPQGLGKYKSESTGVSNVAGRSAAALALGHQVFKDIPGHLPFAAQCLQDAIELFEMGKKREGFQQGNSYGAPYRYNERTWADDMEWGAAALFKATGDKKYLNDALHYADLIGFTSWMEMDSAAHYEMYPYVNMGHYALWQVVDDKIIRNKLADYYEHNLLKIQERADKNAYGVGHLFIWCSNNLAAAVATQALLYEQMTGDVQFRPLLQNHLNWLFGLNPWGTSMITGIPANGEFPLDVHMPFWILNKQVVPGSLVDGPLWSSIHDKMLAIRLNEPDEFAHLQPDHIKYWDDFADYSTNEPTMDGSADLMLLLAHFAKPKIK